MASISEQIATAVLTALLDEIPAVGARVYRAREEALTRTECPAIVVRSVSEDPTPISVANDVHEVVFRLSLEIFVHAESDEVWETLADAVAVPAHALLMAATLPAGVTNFAGPVATGFAQSADGTPASRTMVYECTFYRSATALDVAA